jgi:hypothetical protein
MTRKPECDDPLSGDRQRAEDRRTDPNRRSGLDRRGSGLREKPSKIERRYGFRDFKERRAAQDRRLYTPIDWSWDRPGSDHSGRCGADTGARFTGLSREEILMLLADLDD